MSYSSLHPGNNPSSSDTFMKWNIAGPSLFGFFKSCFPYIYYSRKALSSRVKLSSSVRKQRLKAKVWEAEQVISCIEGNTWKHYLSTERIRMQENAFKYISSEGKNIYGMPWDCKSGHNSSSGNKALYFRLKNSWLWLLLVYPLYKTSIKGKENRFSLFFKYGSMWKLNKRWKCHCYWHWKSDWENILVERNWNNWMSAYT